MVYESNDPAKRMGLWDSLSFLASQVGRWVAMGHFNIIRSPQEKIDGSPPDISTISEFNSCLDACGLDDMAGTSPDFTCLISMILLLMFPQTSATFLTPGLFDHCPAILSFSGDPMPKKRFKFLNCWIDHPDYRTMVMKAWDISVIGNSMFKLMAKLKNYDPFSEPLISMEKQLSLEFWKLKDAEAKTLIQRAKIHNIKHDDVCSKFFFAKIKERQQSQYISEIQDTTGTTHRGVHEASPVTREEIKQALFSINSNKSPRLDGFSAGIFKSVWDIIAEDYCSAVEDFFRTGFMPKQAIVTLISLIPKKKVVQTVKDFRPISCCSIIYKTISKILTNRLQGVMSKLVGIKQAAFINNRSLHENVMLTQGLLKGGDLPFVKKATQVLLEFSKWSSLKSNFEKSDAYFGGTSLDTKLLILAATGLAEGKLQVINSIVFGIGNFWCTSLLLPKNVANYIATLCRQNLWGYTEGQRKMTLKSWTSICTPWSEGGFHLKDLPTWNLSHMLKWLWAIDHGRGSSFSVGKAYELLHPKLPALIVYKAIQDNCLLPRHKIILMLAVQHKLLTADMLSKRGFSLATSFGSPSSSKFINVDRDGEPNTNNEKPD
ncbi:uncharacterized protein LOC141601123 [Silene latifolia]|uniref:uncharacterized protein LOC141601123 n=1 Tax=Silene latifolia TaxID=37657 RepID=UPI003D777082